MFPCKAGLSTGSCSSCNHTRRNKEQAGCKGRDKIISIYRWQHCQHRKSQRLLKKKKNRINEFDKVTDKIYTKKSISFLWTSLVVQWIMQGTQVWSFVQEDSTCCRAAKPVCWNYWSTYSLRSTRAASTMRSLRTTAREPSLLVTTGESLRAATKT